MGKYFADHSLLKDICSKNIICTMSEEKKKKKNNPVKQSADDLDDFKLFLKKKKLQNEVLKKIIEKPELGLENK